MAKRRSLLTPRKIGLTLTRTLTPPRPTRVKMMLSLYEQVSCAYMYSHQSLVSEWRAKSPPRTTKKTHTYISMYSAIWMTLRKIMI